MVTTEVIDPVMYPINLAHLLNSGSNTISQAFADDYNDFKQMILIIMIYDVIFLDTYQFCRWKIINWRSKSEL
jgi:hypothetical protein